MKTISAGLKSLLESSQALNRIELLTITLEAGAGVLYFNSGQVDLVYNGHTYLAGDQGTNPGFKRGSVTTKIGTDVTTMELTLFGDPNTMVMNGTITPQAFAAAGGFDNAIIEVDCMPMPVGSWDDTSRGTYNIWTGIAGDVIVERTNVVIEVDSLLRYLQGSFPRNFLLPTCNHTLYDGGCTLNKASFAVAGTVANGSWTTTQFDSNLISQPDDYFDLGWITFTGGQNDGLTRTVKTSTQSGGVILLIEPLPYVPAFGDTFTAFPGCDKTQSTCTNKFNNLANFRGFPFVPNPIVMQAGQGTGTPSGAIGGAIGGGRGGAGNTFKQF